MKTGRRCGWFFGLAMVLTASGCVERTARIRTNPEGALVVVNDEEVGVSPVRFSFLWYGDYDIIIRKPGYKTLKTHYRIEAPWYQVPPIDLVSEALVPTMIRDEHELPVFALEVEPTPSVTDVVNRAVELQDRTLYEGG